MRISPKRYHFSLPSNQNVLRNLLAALAEPRSHCPA